VKKYLFFVLIVCLSFSVLLFGEGVQYGGTLWYGDDDGQLAFNLNPFYTNVLDTVSLIYEPLGYINEQNGDVTPLLGVSYEWEDNNLELIVTTRKDVKWSDGIPFTARDVAFTFNYIKAYPALDLNGIWSPILNLQSVEASGDNTVIFKFSKPSVSAFYYIYSQQVIVPEHIWSKIENPVSYTNPNPVGTGPFLFKDFSSALNRVTAVKNPNYWMKGHPYVDEVIYQSYESDSAVLLNLLSGNIQWTSLNVPNVKQMWIDKNPTTNLIWWLPVANREIAFNTQKYPFNNPIFRRALNLAINKEEISSRVYYGMVGLPNPTGISPTQANGWTDPTLKASITEALSYDPSKAIDLLASIGFKKNAAGQLCGPDGKPLPTFSILTESWTDGTAICQIVANDLKQIGINAVVQIEGGGAYTNALQLGYFDMAYTWEQGVGPSPYYTYFMAFDPTFSATAIGKPALADYCRYTNPLITAALEIYNSTTDLHLQKQAIYTIERIVLEDMPFIAITQRETTTEFSGAKFTGWPTNENPYVGRAALFDVGAAELVAMNVHLK